METKDIQGLVAAVSEEPVLQPQSVPGLDLYVDQVTTLLEETLQATKRTDKDKIMTKTMINNYSKEHLLPESHKKKYNKQHLLLLQLIYQYKAVLSIADIHTLLDPLVNNRQALEKFYENFLASFDTQKSELAEWASEVELETEDDVRQLAALLVTRASLEKRLAERLLDTLSASE